MCLYSQDLYKSDDFLILSDVSININSVSEVEFDKINNNEHSHTVSERRADGKQL